MELWSPHHPMAGMRLWGCHPALPHGQHQLQSCLLLPSLNYQISISSIPCKSAVDREGCGHCPCCCHQRAPAPSGGQLSKRYFYLHLIKPVLYKYILINFLLHLSYYPHLTGTHLCSFANVGGKGDEGVSFTARCGAAAWAATTTALLHPAVPSAAPAALPSLSLQVFGLCKTSKQVSFVPCMAFNILEISYVRLQETRTHESPQI